MGKHKPKTDWEVRARHNWMTQGVDVLVRADGKNFVLSNTGQEYREDEIVPMFLKAHEGGETFLRAALNAAWEIGLRPDGYHDTRESLKATQAHLEDMRSIAFHKVGASKPQPNKG